MCQPQVDQNEQAQVKGCMQAMTSIITWTIWLHIWCSAAAFDHRDRPFELLFSSPASEVGKTSLWSTTLSFCLSTSLSGLGHSTWWCGIVVWLWEDFIVWDNPAQKSIFLRVMPLEMLENIILWVLRFVYLIYQRQIDLRNKVNTQQDEVNTLKTEIELLKEQNEKFKLELVLFEARLWSAKKRLDEHLDNTKEEMRDTKADVVRAHHRLDKRRRVVKKKSSSSPSPSPVPRATKRSRKRT